MGRGIAPRLGILCLAAAAGLAASGCDDSDSHFVPNVEGQAPAARTLSGTITYERVPFFQDQLGSGLNYGETTRFPVRHVRVDVIDHETEDILVRTTTSDTGAYSASFTGRDRVRVRFYAESASPALVIQDNTDGNAVYASESDVIDANDTTVVDLNASTGFDVASNSYDRPRAAGPFAILDTMQRAVETFLAVRPTADFPLLRVNWSPNNRPEAGDPSLGQITTSLYDFTIDQAFVLGAADIDTDEFDAHVIAHEWGHYFEDRVSRLDSIGGAHSLNDILDIRVAFSEGFANAMSAIVQNPDSIYRDSSGTGQATAAIIFDLEDNDLMTPGWFSEGSIGSIIYDLYDSVDDGPDAISLGAGGIYDAMTSATHAQSPYMGSVFTFITATKELNPTDTAAIDALTSGQMIAPVADSLGSGETNDGADASNLPIYHPPDDGDLLTPRVPAAINGPAIDLTLVGSDTPNTAKTNRFIVFQGDGNPVTIVSLCAEDVDLFVFQNGTELAARTGLSGNEVINSLPTTAGALYVINVRGFVLSSSTEYSCQVLITTSGNSSGN